MIDSRASSSSWQALIHVYKSLEARNPGTALGDAGCEIDAHDLM